MKPKVKKILKEFYACTCCDQVVLTEKSAISVRFVLISDAAELQTNKINLEKLVKSVYAELNITEQAHPKEIIVEL